MIKRCICILLTAVSLIFAPSCSGNALMEHCEISITLPRGFEQVENSDYDITYSDGKLAVSLTRISFVAASEEGIPAALSPLAFARLYADKVGITRDIISEYGDFPYVTYRYKNDFRCTEAFLRTPYAYFIVSFVHNEEEAWTLEETLSLLGNIHLDNSKGEDK